MSRPPVTYRALGALLAPLFAGHAVARALRDGGRVYLHQRFGRIEPVPGPEPVWLHCASVGEVVTALPLLQALQDAGIGPLVLSTNTPTGHATARLRAGDDIRVMYLPIDRPRPLRRFLDRLRPRAALILETELWPWLYSELGRRDVPVVLVNARLSARTLDAPRWWRAMAAHCLQQVTTILARSDDDAAGFRQLSAPPERVQVIGNLKLAAAGSEPPAPIELPRPFVLAASTHDDEERQLAAAWRDGGSPEHLLVIAPRHPGRGGAIARELAADGHHVARRSRSEPITPGTGVYLADTLGELTGLMRTAALVIMGGSLIRHGGQNVLEPARAERAIVTGPHMDNFRAETRELLAAGALRQGKDAAAVVAIALELLADDRARTEMGQRGREVLEAGTDMAERYATALVPLLGASR